MRSEELVQLINVLRLSGVRHIKVALVIMVGLLAKYEFATSVTEVSVLSALKGHTLSGNAR